MATFFGEVLSVYSRAVEEDEEQDDENEEDEQIRREIEEKREVHIEWCSEVIESCGSPASQCTDFILAVGPNAAGFLSSYVLSSSSWEAVGRAALWNEKSGGSCRQSPAPQPGEPACVFHRLRENPAVLICQSTCYIAEDQLFQWTEKVLGCVQQRGLSVLVLADSPVSEYKTADYPHASALPFLRSLKTSASKTQTQTQALCPPLEPPNMATGLPAAVLSHCQVHQIPAVLYLCYSDVISPDSITMETYKPALTGLNKLFKLNPCPSTDVLHKLAKAGQTQSNLYT